jgi:hypothetical protein
MPAFLGGKGGHVMGYILLALFPNLVHDPTENKLRASREIH